MDSFAYIALLNNRDAAHERVKQRLGTGHYRELITTAWVLTEVADAMATSPHRRACAVFLESMGSAPATRVVPADDELFRRGIELYAARADKEWSLTDCLSFLVMADERLTDALTGDRHFEQAGFKALLLG